MRASRLEIVLFAWAMFAVVAFGFVSGKAVLGGDRKKDPKGFWLALAVQLFMGLFALFYGLLR
jgi:hypothetical protein